MDFDSIVNERVETVVEWGEHEIVIGHRHYTEELEQAAMGEDGRWTGDGMKRLLLAMVLDWDLTRQGKPYPITMEALRQLPAGLVTGIFMHLQEGIRDPKALKTRSRPSSPAGANGVLSPLGT